MALTGKIDIHHHLEWDHYTKTLSDNGINPAYGMRYPEWSIDKSIDLMDANGIRAAILSVSSPGVYFPGTNFAVELAHECNDYAASLVSLIPSRLGFFAILPMPLVEESVKEAVYALDVLRADGIVLLASAGDKFLGDPDFDELMSELNKRDAIVFIHPNIHSSSEKLGLPIPGFVTEFLFDTTRAVTNLAYSGTFERYPRIRWILAHAGATIPFIAWRLSLSNMDPEFLKRAPRGFAAYLKELYYDTALSTSQYAMAPLLDLVGQTHIVFGSDYPFAPAPLVAKETSDLKTLSVFTQDIMASVDYSNAQGLFPRFKTLQVATDGEARKEREPKLPLSGRIAVSFVRKMMKQ
jgi:Predicted metal-dependent hydrolase of the TIM-barrel fold